MSDSTHEPIVSLARRFAESQRHYVEHIQALRTRLDYIMADEAANRPDLAHLDEAAKLDTSIRHMCRYDDAVAAAFTAYEVASNMAERAISASSPVNMKQRSTACPE